MKLKTEKKIIEALYSLRKPATTQQIADLLKISRSVTSNYLNRLYEKKIVGKKGAKLIYWYLTDEIYWS